MIPHIFVDHGTLMAVEDWPEEPAYDEEIPDWKVKCKEIKAGALPVSNPQKAANLSYDGKYYILACDTGIPVPYQMQEGVFYPWPGEIDKVTKWVTGYVGNQEMDAEIEEYKLYYPWE